MMVLSRIWYVVLSLVVGVAIYVVYLAVGQYNRRNTVAMTEEIASDSQTVGWALQIDARRRLDAMLLGSVDKGVQDALAAADDKDKIPAAAKDAGRKALSAVSDKVPPEYRSDALFAVDHDGRVVAEIGFDIASALDDFELGGYPAVFDALHGYFRDDTWVLGGKVYRVVARPVEFDVTQRPLGAIVGLKLVDDKFVQDLSKKTRANIAFYAQGLRVASSTLEGFDKNVLELIKTDLPKLDQDKSYADGRSDVRMLNDATGAMYARLPGDAWDLGAGFAVARQRVTIVGPLGFLSGADDKDKQSVNWLIIVAAVLIGIAAGVGFSVLEQTLPMGEMTAQAERLKKGDIDYLQLPRFRGGYRAIAQNVNAGIERVLEKGGGAVRKPADLESILGPVPAQPAMSAFSFPLPDQGYSPQPPPPGARGPGLPGPREQLPTRPGALGQQPPAPGFPPGPAFPPAGSNLQQGPGAMPTPYQNTVQQHAPPSSASSPFGSPLGLGGPTLQATAPTMQQPPPRFGGPLSPESEALQDAPTMAAAQAPVTGMMPGGAPAPRPGPPPHGPPRPGPSPGARLGAPTMMGMGLPQHDPPPAITPAAGSPPAQGLVQTAGANPFNVPTTPNEFFPPARSAAGAAQVMNAPSSAAAAPPAIPAVSPSGRQLPPMGEEEQEEATVVAPAPNELLAQASGENNVVGEAAEWLAVYDDFLRTKKQCSEPTDGLTFEKFQNTLRKNRDALMQRHGCKRVRFSVYIKEGRASLKATPVRE